MKTATAQDAWLDAFGRLADERTDPRWLEELRRQAMHRFVTNGFPTVRDEDWLYTNVGPLTERTFHRARATATPNPETLRGHHLDEVAGPRLVFVNGHFDPTLSDLSSLPEGVTLRTIADVLRDAPDTLRPMLEAFQTETPHAFADLGTAFFEDGAYLQIARGAEVAEPIQIVFLMKSWENDVVEHPRLFVDAGENSSATLLERYEAQGPGARFTNTFAAIQLAPAARLRHIRLQREGASAYHVGLSQIRQARDSSYDTVSVSLGGKIARHEIISDLGAEGASCSLGGLYVLGGTEHVDNHTVVHHRVPNGTSHELYKGILGGRAKGAFTGKMVVHRDAQHTSSTQANHNLLLSDDAVADTRPQLEIYADDVQCAHGATIGQLDDAQMFYLRSRGLTQVAARNLLIHGFAREVLEQVADDDIRALLARVLEARLNVDVA